MKVINILFFLFLTCSLNSQILIYQDIFNGGVTGDGYDCSFSNDPGILNVNINPGSTIKKAILLTTMYQHPANATFFLNSNPVILNPQNDLINEYWESYSGSNYLISTLISDVTPYINSSDNSYNLIPVQNQSANITNDGGYASYYLLIVYENPLLPKMALAIYNNNKNAYYFVNYPITELNPIDLNYEVGLTLNASDICDTVNDGSYVKINTQDIGLIGGQEDNTTWSCTGSKGSFFYQNNTTYGIGNDNANATMSGPDVLANIESFLSSTTSFDVSFSYQQGFSGGYQSNPIHQLFLAYTSTCDTFSVTTSKDTSICRGETLQLYATGGTSTGSAPAYEWLPTTDLSCSTCPNPIFTGDSSQFYTVRIWNNDSCSVVRPVKVIVREEPQFGSINSTPAICGTNTGQVILSAQVGTATPISYSWNSGINQTSGTFSNLFDGNQLFTMQDGFGCTNDTLITVLENNPTIAQFTVNPASGAVPLTVSVSNTSQFATTYDWWLNDSNQGSVFSSFVCDTSGTYSIQLIAWQFDPSCADTFSLSVIAFDSVIIQLPNVFTPNTDGINDFFTFTANTPLSVDVVILNRWGNVVFNFSGDLPDGQTNLWNGKIDGEITDGTYFYNVEVKASNETPLKIVKQTPFPIKSEGFVQLIR